MEETILEEGTGISYIMSVLFYFITNTHQPQTFAEYNIYARNFARPRKYLLPRNT